MMTGLLNSQPPKPATDPDFQYEAHFRNGAEGILARPEAPKLRFPDSMPLEFVRDTIEQWNVQLQGQFPGAGYYAFSPEEEAANPGCHVLVLFANASFCDSFLGSVRSGSLSPNIGGELRQYLSE